VGKKKSFHLRFRAEIKGSHRLSNARRPDKLPLPASAHLVQRQSHWSEKICKTKLHTTLHSGKQMKLKMAPVF